MEESTPAVTTRSVGIRYGVIMAVIGCIIFIAFTLGDVDMTSGIGRWASLPIYFVLIFLAHKNFKEQGDGFMSYGQGMGISFWLAIVSTALYSAFFYIYIKFIDGGFIEAIKAKQIEEMQNRGMSDDQIDQAMQFAGAFMSPEAMLIFSVIGGIIMVVICGLIVSIFTQNKNPQADI